MKTLKLLVISCLIVGFNAPAARAQSPYGPSVSLAQARKALAAAEAEAKKNDWNVVIAVVDAGGHLVLLQRMDDTQFGSVEVARQKAWSAAAFRRPTKAFQDVLAGGGEGMRILKVEGASPVEGGVPLVLDGKVVGAIGVSGVTSAQDGQIAQAGADSLQ